MAYDIQRLLPRHFEIVNLSLAGYGPKEIAQALEMTPQAISNIVNSTLFQDEIARRRKDIEKDTNTNLASVPMRARQELENASLDAVNTLKNNLTNPNGNVSNRAADSILDKVFGNDKNEKPSVIIMNQGDLLIFKETLKELEIYDRERKRRVECESRTPGLLGEEKTSRGSVQESPTSKESTKTSGILQSPQEVDERV